MNGRWNYRSCIKINTYGVLWIEYIHVICIRITENLVLLLNNTVVKLFSMKTSVDKYACVYFGKLPWIMAKYSTNISTEATHQLRQSRPRALCACRGERLKDLSSTAPSKLFLNHHLPPPPNKDLSYAQVYKIQDCIEIFENFKNTNAIIFKEL